VIRFVLALILLVPSTLSAQEKASAAATNQEGTPSPLQIKLGSGDNYTSTVELGDEANVASNPDANAPQQPSAKPTQSTAPSEPAPKIPGSMVGYIDDPIVRSEIRIRFDDAFEDRFPDRSEFFYAKCSCYRLLNTVPPLQLAFDPHAPGPGTSIPTAINFQQLYVNVEYAPVRRFSLFSEVPIRWLQPQGFFGTPPGNLPPGATTFGNQSGLSDVTAGFKFAAIASEGTYLTFQFKSYFPSGDASKGLGTNHYSVEPSLLLYHKLSSRFTFEGQVGDWHPIGGSAGVPITGSEGFAGDVFFYGLGPSYKLYRGRSVGVTPVVELFGWHVLGGFQTNPNAGPPLAANEVSGLNIVNLKVGLRIGFGFHNSIYAGFGQALTHDDWYKHIVRLEYRYTF
jgi:Putative MetA-pathway of phenol degradation